MIISSQNLRAIFIGFNTTFNKALEEQKPLYDRVATVVPSTTDAETYAWLGDIPGMREWLGEREIKNLSGSDYTIKNKDFELTVGVPRNAIEDDKIGLYTPSVQMLGQSAAMHPDELIFGLLKKGFTEKCFDGKPFFSADHEIKEGEKVSNKGTAKLTLDSYIAARAAMMSLTNAADRALGIVPNLLVVPPALEGVARSITTADFINGSTNTMKGTAEALVVPQLAGKDAAWYLLCTTRPIRPLIYQQRRKAKFVGKTAENDDNVFFNKEYIYGVDSRGNAGFGFWQMAYGSDGSNDA